MRKTSERGLLDRIELLAPARDLETGYAAINCGADAIYLGAARFGARESAGNPLGDIEQLIHYAHKYWARVYVTVNTLLFNAELAEAEKLVNQLYEAGADALIIQDIGLLEMELPPIPLFASTQMHNHTPERIAFLERVGFQRAILARELTIEQIHEIRSQTKIELETFIHGALCVSYSGQCYLSYVNGGRSGNRGQCAQPCRKPYALVGRDGQRIIDNRYLLSLHDLNLSASLAELVDAGVCSFKIEGRLKDKAYVMNVVGHYRRLLDAVLNERGMRAAASGAVHLDFEPDPRKTFNRGFSSYFLHGRGADIAALDTPKSLGEPLGRVAAVGARSFTLEPGTPPLHPADGLCFFKDQKELSGTIVNRVEGNTIFPASLEGLVPGVQVYRNHDQVFSEQLRKSQTARKMRLNFSLEAVPSGLCLTAVDEDGNRASFSLETVLEPAQQVEKARETISRQLNKLGETDFECAGINHGLDPLPFIPVSTLNALRRGAMEQLAAVRELNRPRTVGGAVYNNAPYPEKRLAFTGNVLNELAVQFYHHHGVETIEPAAESGLDLTGRVVMTTKTCLRYQLNACPRQPNPQKLPEPLKLVDEQGVEYPLRFNCPACVMEVYFRKRPD
jgi:collagenase-like PrtC family protease